MPTTEDRKEVAQKLREIDTSNITGEDIYNGNGTSILCAYIAGAVTDHRPGLYFAPYYFSAKPLIDRLAELIDPESVPTCQMIEQHDWGDEWEPYGIYCSKCHEFVPQWKSRSRAVLNGDTDMPLPNYCPNCGAKVIHYED